MSDGERELDINGDETFQSVTGRWARMTLRDIQDNKFWSLLHAAHTSRGPSMHLLFWMQQQATATTERKSKLASHRLDLLDASQPTTVQQMVCGNPGKAKELADEYEQLLDDAAYDKVWRHVWELTPEDDLERMRSECVLLVLEGACDYAQRVTKPCTRLPLSLAWVVHSGPEVKCGKRVEVAQELLSLIDDDDPPVGLGPGTTPFKIAVVFRKQWVAVCASGGVIDVQLYGLMQRLVRAISSDQQEIEGMNGVVKHLMEVAPSMGLELLSARVCNKKRVASFHRSKDSKQAIKDLLHTCVGNHKLALAAHSDTSRMLLDQDAGAIVPCAPAVPAAAAATLKNRKAATLKNPKCLMNLLTQVKGKVGKDGMPSSRLLYVLKHGCDTKYAWLASLVYRQAPWTVGCSQADVTMTIIRPFQIKPLREILEEQHSLLMSTGAPQIHLAAYSVRWHRKSLRQAETHSTPEWTLTLNDLCKCHVAPGAEGYDDNGEHDQLAQDLWEIMEQEEAPGDYEEVETENTDLFNAVESRQSRQLAAQFDLGTDSVELNTISEAVQEQSPGCINDPVQLCHESLLNLSLQEGVGIQTAIPQVMPVIVWY